MPTLVFDKFSSLFGDERGLGLPFLTHEEREAEEGKLTKYRVIGIFDEGDDVDLFERRFMRDVDNDDIKGFIKLELLSNDKVEFIVYTENETVARNRFLGVTLACGYEPHVESITAI